MSKLDKAGSPSTRRKFLKKSALGAGAIGSLSSFSLNQENDTPKSDAVRSDDLPIQLAGYDYDRVKPLIDGKVKIKGCSISYTKAGIGDMNTEAFTGAQKFDVSEIGLHPFMLAYANNNFRDYSLLPIFPLRVYRHKSVFIRNDKGINNPEDLRGRKIGTPAYSSSSLTWIRGLFQDEYNINPEDVQWVTSNMDSSADVAGKVSGLEQFVPEGISLTKGPPGKDESDLLVSGEVDALFHAVEPKAYAEGNPLIERLFPDPRKVEQSYFTKTGIFPIMHAVAVKNKLIDENPWIVKSVFDAYSQAKKINFAFMSKLGWAYDSLPWYGHELEETQKLMGKNFWPYGIEANRKTLETLFRYSYDQGLSSKKLTMDDLFHPSSLEFKEV